MAQKHKIDEPQPATDLEPVELDPPAPEIVRWQELAEREIDLRHEGDASRVIQAPRPAWSDPDEDLVDGAPHSSVYMSSPARVALCVHQGLSRDDGDELMPARVVVRAFMGSMFDQELRGLEVRVVKRNKGKDKDEKPWFHTVFSLSVSEARELVDVILAAVDLVGGDR